MPPKKRKPLLVWLPTTWKCLVTTTGEFREYYLPLSNEEIEKDLLHLSSLLAQAGAKRPRRPAAHLQPAAGEASSEEYSPSSQQGEEENESGNPSDQQQWVGHAQLAPHAGASAGAPQQQQAAVA